MILPFSYWQPSIDVHDVDVVVVIAQVFLRVEHSRRPSNSESPATFQTLDQRFYMEKEPP